PTAAPSGTLHFFTCWAAARLKSARPLPKTPSPRNGAIVRTLATFRFVINGWERGRPAPLCRGGRPVPGAAVRKRATTRVAPTEARIEASRARMSHPSEVAVGRAPEYESAAVIVTEVRVLPGPDRADPRRGPARGGSFPT